MSLPALLFLLPERKHSACLIRTGVYNNYMHFFYFNYVHCVFYLYSYLFLNSLKKKNPRK